MSGGQFDYKQFNIREIADDLEKIIKEQGKKVSEDDQYHTEEWLKENPSDAFYETFSDEIDKELRKGLNALRIAYIYTLRIDWYLSGDMTEEGFIKRLKEDLNEQRKG